ncbi:MAG: lamin tail domain-containing protein [Sandaracinaceae bacterium]
MYAGSGTDDGTTVFTGIAETRFAADAAVSLLDDAGQGVDFVRFGSSAAPAPTGTAWFGAGAIEPGGSDLSSRRNLAVLDTDGPADWVIGSPSTPGFLCWPGMSTCDGVCVNQAIDPTNCGGCGVSCSDNETCLSGSCSTVGAVVLSELRNNGAETIDIFNGTAASVDLEGWSVEWAADGGSGSFSLPAGTSLASGDELTLSETSGSAISNFVPMATAVNWTADIAVTLRDDAGNAVDFVRTGASSVSPPAGTTWTGAPASTPDDGAPESLVRARWSADTNTAADWSIQESRAAGLCSSSEVVCGGECGEFPSAENCGACGNACPAGLGCAGGVCDDPDGELRINEDGILLVRIGTLFRAVCDDSFADLDANVACRQLGRGSGTPDYSTPSFSLLHQRQFECDAGDVRLSECETSFGSCGDSETVGLNCAR